MVQSFLMRWAVVVLALPCAALGCSSSSASGSASAPNGPPTPSAAMLYGMVYQGQYNLGPVDFAESQRHNACAPQGGYRTELRATTGLGGEYLAGVSDTYARGGGVCDACIQITTAAGKSIVARVVTYGVSNAPGDLDVSPSVYATLSTGEYPRTMSWQFAKCPGSAPLQYEFQTGANVYWTSLWVRNPRVPLAELAVISTNHSGFTPLARGSDGTLTDASGFGSGQFQFRLTGMDGQVLMDTVPSFAPGQLITSSAQFQ